MGVEGSAISGACIGAVVAALAAIALLIFASSRKAADAVKEKPRNARQVNSPLPYNDAIGRVLQLAPTQGYKVEETAPDGSRVILSTPVTLMSYGFFYPIYFTPQSYGTMIEVAIQSRGIQWGPVVSNNLEKCVRMVVQATVPPQYTQPQPPQYMPPQQPPYPPAPPSPPTQG